MLHSHLEIEGSSNHPSSACTSVRLEEWSCRDSQSSAIHLALSLGGIRDSLPCATASLFSFKSNEHSDLRSSFAITASHQRSCATHRIKSLSTGKDDTMAAVELHKHGLQSAPHLASGRSPSHATEDGQRSHLPRSAWGVPCYPRRAPRLYADRTPAASGGACRAARLTR